MIVCYRRQLTYLLLGLPLVAYLVLVLCLLTRVCPRSGQVTTETETEFREKYQALVKMFREHVLSKHGSRNTGDILSSDLRKLLDLEGKGRMPEHINEKDFDEELEKFVEKFRGRTGEIQHEDINSDTFGDLNVHVWRARESKTNPESQLDFQDIAKNDLGYPRVQYPQINFQDVAKSDSGYQSVQYPQYPQYIHNCSSISSMRIKTQLGHGVSKQAFVADYQGTQVVIKMVTRHVTQVKNCLKRLREVKAVMSPSPKANPENAQNNLWINGDSFISLKENADNIEYNHAKQRIRDSFISSHGDPTFVRNTNRTVQRTAKDQSESRAENQQSESSFKQYQVELTPAERQSCYIPPTARVMKEILLSQQLHHPNLASMLGYCVRSEESETTDISEHGVISVFELGSRFVLDSLQILPWPTRLRHAIEMASLLHYLEFSPLGSLVVPDFKEGHVIMANDSLKLIDLDDVNNLEPECGLKRHTGDDKCPYGLRCSRALCEGFNGKENLKNMNRLVFKRLLFPTTFPSHVISEVGQLNADMDTLRVTAGQVLDRLRRIQHLADMQDLT